MAEVSVNGNYGTHQAYGSTDGQQQYNSGAYAHNSTVMPQQPAAPSTNSSGVATSASSQGDIPKDEVGWYFVEQYYTTLSRSPEKLYLFYNKRSQFVSGQETDKVPVCVGQRAINDKIKQLDFQDCKVRVTNVDSQASDSNIVIQVIGEISNKSQPHKKFTQTFVLATQTNGYFVLNDIFRYIVEEEDEAEQESSQQVEEVQQEPAAESTEEAAAPPIEAAEPKSVTAPSGPIAVQHDAGSVDAAAKDKAVEETVKDETTSQAVNGEASQSDHEEATESVADATPAVPTPDASEDSHSEKPETAEPTPAVSPPKQAPAQPVAPAKPAAPKTWASLAASANRVATPIAPSAQAQPAVAPKATVPAATSKPQAAVPTSAPTSAPAQAAAPTGPAAQRQRDESPASSQQDEWTAVGGAHSRQQSRQVAPQSEPQGNRAYIKNVFEGVDTKELRKHLEKFGEIAYLDISRAKNCAFVDFKTAEGYAGAVGANPHDVNGEQLYVEERKIRPGQSFGPGQRVPFQNARGGRGGPNQGPPRGGFQGNRGGNNFQPRGGRGGTSSPRGGRGGAQAAA